jgi:hypothetical protein
MAFSHFEGKETRKGELLISKNVLMSMQLESVKNSDKYHEQIGNILKTENSLLLIILNLESRSFKNSKLICLNDFTNNSLRRK